MIISIAFVAAFWYTIWRVTDPERAYRRKHGDYTVPQAYYASKPLTHANHTTALRPAGADTPVGQATPPAGEDQTTIRTARRRSGKQKHSIMKPTNHMVMKLLLLFIVLLSLSSCIVIDKQNGCKRYYRHERKFKA